MTFIPGSRSRPPLPVGFWPMDKVYKHRELTGRSHAVQWSDAIIYTDDSPLDVSQGQ